MQGRTGKKYTLQSPAWSWAGIRTPNLGASGIRRCSSGSQDIEAGEGLFWRCHWSGCRKMVPALRDSIETHLQLAHGLHQDLKNCHQWVISQAITEGKRTYFQCRWQPAMLVNLADSQRVLFLTHSQSYYCGRVIFIVQHIGTHLLHEQKPNPLAEWCETCQRSFLLLKQHKCRTHV